MRKLGELLKEAGVLDDAGLQKALARQQQTKKRLGDTLLELRIVTEDQLFECLARQLEIQIIPEAKLLLVEVQRAVIDLLPAQLAWELQVLPLLMDPSRKQIAIVTAEPNDPRMLEGVKNATGIAMVKPYLAKRSALRKVLEKYYGPEPVFSAGLEELLLEDAPADAPPAPAPPANAPPPPAVPVQTGAKRPGPVIKEVSRAPHSAPVATPSAGSRAPVTNAPVNTGRPVEAPDSTGALRARNAAKQRIIRNVIVADTNKSIASSVKRTLEMEYNYTVEIATTPEEILNLVKAKPYDLVVVKGAIAENIGELERRVRAVFPMIEFRAVPSFATELLGDPVGYNRLVDFMFDSLDLMLGLIARGDNTLRKRAATNARYAKLVAQKLLLPRKSIDEVYLAAFLDAVGDVIVRTRGGDQSDRTTARRLAIELFRSITPPYDIETVLICADERFDGSGPRGMRGDQIPIGSRVLAVVLGYADAKGMAPDQLQKFLREMSGRLFDQRIVETFLQILRAEALLGDAGGKIEAAGTVLIVDKDVAHTSTLELRLVNEGYKVLVSGDGQAALEMARQSPPALILSEIAVPRMDGFNLCMTLKSDPKTESVPFVFVSGKNDEFNSNKALEVGGDDFIGKPVNVEFLLKKLAKFLQKPKAAAPAAAGGVQGRLADFGLIELIQTLSLGMKTAKLELKHDAQGLASIYLEEGRLVHASTLEKQGEEAFYQIATWADGAFQILTGQQTKEKNVGVSNDFLILEALRRMDEAEAGISQDGKESSSVTRRQ